jgi:hypothetical protein
MKYWLVWILASLVSYSAAASAQTQSATVSVPITVTGASTATLPNVNNASANWKMAGMQSVGGIPQRNAICATLSPLGGAQDDTARINNAIASCPIGQVLMLASGTFTVHEANYINLNKGITIRGTGACNNANSPY